MRELNGVGKGIFLGGAFCGIISLIPFINLFNIFFMFWMGVGGFLGVYLLKKENRTMKTSDAALIGALSGITGGLIFALATTLAVFNISEEKIERIMGMAEKISSLLNQELTSWLDNIDLRSAFLGIIMISLFFSVVSGTIGGLISKIIFFPGKKREVK